MKKTLTLLVAIGSIVCAKAQKPFTPGNLVIYRVGDGTKTLGTTAAPVFLDEHTTSLVLTKQTAPVINTIALPGTSGSAPAGNYLLTAAGTGTTEGQITRSVDGKYLVFAGYNSGSDTSTAPVATSVATTTARVIGTADLNGTINTTTALTNFASKYAPRSVVSPDGNLFFMCYSSTSIRKAFLGATTCSTISSHSTTNVNQSPTAHSLEIYDGQLYGSYQSSFGPLNPVATDVTLATIGTGIDTASGQSIAALPGIDTTYPSVPTTKTSPYQFFMVDLPKGKVLYIADDGTNGALTERGIQKYSLVSGSWSYNGSIYAKGVKGLTGYNSGDTVALFATSSTKLFGAFDLAGWNQPPFSPTPGDSAIVLDTAVAKTQFRGIAYTPGTPVLTPVKFATGLSGALVNGFAKLTWATATEVSTKSFVIEKSIDGKSFSTLELIPAKNKPSAYEYTDASKLTGSAYYRLKVTNNDGSYSYSSSVQLSNKVSVKMSVYPNPVVNTATVSHTQAVSGAVLKVSSISGKTISTYNVQLGATQTSINVGNLTKGNYVISYENNGEVSTTKFVK